jgi:hypothetical protein
MDPEPDTIEMPPDQSGDDIDIWGDGSPTHSTPIPEEWDWLNHEEQGGHGE